MPADLTLLDSFLRERANDPFAWGTRDCATLVFDALHLMTGVDPAAQIRGRWTSATSAARVFNACGGWEGFAETGALGLPVKPGQDLQDGDVVLLEAAHCGGLMAVAGSLGLVYKQHIMAQGEDGIVVLPIDAADRAWRPE
jgi:hypothetical protein